MELDFREQRVLQTIIDSYITNANPVGSRYVAKNSQLNLSPASIRNSMADLTEKGYLSQPHASAGRVPTGEAFRFYIHSTLRLSPLSRQEEYLIQTRLGDAGLEISRLLQQASSLLASLSNQVSMVLAPQQDEIRWQQIDFVLVRQNTVLAILVAQGGIVHQRLLKVDEPIDSDELVTLSNYLNTHFRDQTLFEVKTVLLQEMQQAHGVLDALSAKALDLARATCLDNEQERYLFVNGAARLLDQPELSDLCSVRRLLSLLEERTRIYALLEKVSLRRPAITLGDEFDEEQFVDWSIVSAPYHLQGQALGLVSIIGPMRMDYSRVLPMVDFTAQILTQLLRNG